MSILATIPGRSRFVFDPAHPGCTGPGPCKQCVKNMAQDRAERAASRHREIDQLLAEIAAKTGETVPQVARRLLAALDEPTLPPAAAVALAVS